MTSDLSQLGDRLRAARRRRGLHQRALAKASGVPQTTISRLEAGTATRTPLTDIDRLAEALGVPLTMLLSGSPVRERAKLATRSAADADLVGAKEYALELLEFDSSLDRVAPALLLPRQFSAAVAPQSEGSAADQGAQLATQLRDFLNLGAAPLTDLPEVLEEVTGVDVATARLEGASGVCAIDPERGMRLIAVACTEPAERQRFSLAHELAHILFGDTTHVDKVDGARTFAERRCDEFARHFLAPAVGVRAWLQRELGTPATRPVDERAIALLARHFIVSPEVMRIQLSELNLLPAEITFVQNGRFLAQRYGWISQYEAEQQAASVPRPPRRVLERAHAAYQNGKLGLGAIAKLENRTIKDLARDVNRSMILVADASTPSPLDKLLSADAHEQ